MRKFVFERSRGTCWKDIVIGKNKVWKENIAILIDRYRKSQRLKWSDRETEELSE